MKCSQAQPNLLDYSQGRLSQTEAAAVRTHLDGCPECRALLQEEIQLAEGLAGIPLIAPISDVWEKVEAGISPVSRKMGIFDLLRTSYAKKASAAIATVALASVALVMAVPKHSATDEKESIAKAAALMSTQPITAAKADELASRSNDEITPVDDPVGGTTDDMMKVIEDEL